MNTLSADLNQVRLIGKLGDFPKIHYLSEHKAICRIRLATNEPLKDPMGNPFIHTEWHTVVIKDLQTAELCHSTLIKGDQIEVIGKIRQIHKKQNNYSIKYFEIWADKINFIHINKSKIDGINQLNDDYGKSKH